MSSDIQSNSQLFELELALPDSRLTDLAHRLVGFNARYERLQRDLQLLIDVDGMVTWSRRFYKQTIPIIDVVADRYPLVIFHGDVGTGKTVTAEAISNTLTAQLNNEARLFKLSTRVRGTGQVGQMSSLINQAFEIVTKEAGKRRLAFLILDEADSLAAARETDQSHHEDKVAVNTLIQKIDDIRRFKGRILVYLCTNRFGSLDPAILRRAGRIEHFERPNDVEREELLRLDCEGLGLSDETIDELVSLTGIVDGRVYGFTYSDLRTRLLPEALAHAFPDRRIEPQDLLDAAQTILPTPPMNGLRG